MTRLSQTHFGFPNIELEMQSSKEPLEKNEVIKQDFKVSKKESCWSSYQIVVTKFVFFFATAHALMCKLVGNFLTLLWLVTVCRLGWIMFGILKDEFRRLVFNK